MDAKQNEIYAQLVNSLEGIVTVYRHLLDVVRKEKEILVSAHLDDLNENNKAKEAMLIKIHTLDLRRHELALELSQSLGITTEEPRLTEMAKYVEPEQGERLRNLHSVLDLLLKRVRDFNAQNEVLVSSALENINGAMTALRDSLKDKPTYRKKGDVSAKPAQSGQLVSREA